jgi:CDGSH-type Zn-finger protein
MAIRTIESLRQHLQWAIEIEHATLPPYLCALYSIKQGRNREAVEVIHSVFLEEMLHMTLAANLLNAVGGLPRIDAPGFMPSFPAFLPHSNRAFAVSLTKFSPDALASFLRIERPAEHVGLPEDDEFETIGQFYEAIGEALPRLCREVGEDALFTGDPARQVTDELYYGGGGRIIAVRDLASALAALAEIVEQGEGLQHKEIWDGDRDMFHPERGEVAHYFRFNELAAGRRYQPGDTPQSGPTGESFTVDWDAVHDMRPNPRAGDYPEGSEIRARLDEFNRSYSSILHLLHESLNGSPRLLAVATGLMYGLKEEAIRLMELPTGDGKTSVGPSFEYVPPGRRHLAGSAERKILVVPNGPYLVYGNVPLVRKRKIVSAERHSIVWDKTEVLETEETYALCRCGQSSAKPFCDGTHARIGFDGSESADPRATAERAKVLPGSTAAADGEAVLEGAGIVVKRDPSLCMRAGFCVGRLKGIPAMMAGAADSDVRAQIIGMIERCPSGSYTYSLTPGGRDVEPDLPAAIAVTAEEGELAGALWVTGGIPVQRSDGQPFETRNRTTLCRCGRSKKKPLCDGTHRDIGFQETAAGAACRLPTLS